MRADSCLSLASLRGAVPPVENQELCRGRRRVLALVQRWPKDTDRASGAALSYEAVVTATAAAAPATHGRERGRGGGRRRGRRGRLRLARRMHELKHRADGDRRGGGEDRDHEDDVQPGGRTRRLWPGPAMLDQRPDELLPRRARRLARAPDAATAHVLARPGPPGTRSPGSALAGTRSPGTRSPGTRSPGTRSPGTRSPGSALAGTGSPGSALAGTGSPGSALAGTGSPGSALAGT